MLHMNYVVQLPPQDSGLQLGIARFHNLHIDAKRQDHSRLFRRNAVCIVNPENGAWIIRYAMGSGGVKGVCKDSVGLDYDGVDALGIRFNQPAQLVIRRARRREVIRWLATYPDLPVRLGIQLGLLGAVLGLLGAGLGIMGLAIGLISLL
ncbi:hypothetical protein [Halomonas sp. KO116]|uniref:hypothetical protein n=1 Tax=Halomonas sp. KO116 TaxID=1504981 RepID=UPI0004E3C08F|nr:hypothetical protein [Halomonas sp. KO116]AJY53186.1 hypothetical protein KO116_P200079 [Halomonas sp. KO116]